MSFLRPSSSRATDLTATEPQQQFNLDLCAALQDNLHRTRPVKRTLTRTGLDFHQVVDEYFADIRTDPLRSRLIVNKRYIRERQGVSEEWDDPEDYAVYWWRRTRAAGNKLNWLDVLSIWKEGKFMQEKWDCQFSGFMVRRRKRSRW